MSSPKFDELEAKFDRYGKLEEALAKLESFISNNKTAIKYERLADEALKAKGEKSEDLKKQLNDLREKTLPALKTRIDGLREDIRWMEQAS